ncbi:MAG: LCP family protein [Candidatus Saccharimonadales bacterium]
MKPQRRSTDGFIPRRSIDQPVRRSPELTRRPISASGSRGLVRPTTPAQQPARRTSTPEVTTAQQSRRGSEGLARSTQGLQRSEKGLTPTGQSLRRSDVDASLKSIVDPPLPKSAKKPRRVRKSKKPTTKKKIIIKRIAIGIVIIGLIIGGWLGYKALHAGGNIFNGGLLGLIQNKPLQQDKNGRSNILVLGTSEDDPGHQGADLTDSMMIVSINQNDKSVSMFSIPRDLYVKYGQACPAGYEGKINGYFSCSNGGDKPADEQDRLAKTRKFVGEIFGMDVQYAVHVNNTVIKQAVDAVDGIDVKIEGNGPVPYGVKPGSILDRNFDWRCNYQCHLVKYSPGVHHIDGKHALFLSMARGDAVPTYGLVDSNFDREKNQQKIIIGLKEKAVSTGTLSNIGKVTGLIDALGDNLRTTFDTSEIRTLMQLGTDIQSENIVSIGLFDRSEPVVKTGNYGGASVVMPIAGIFDYSGIRQYLSKKLSANPITREGADIVVANGSGVAGVAQTEADKLGAEGYLVSDTTNAPEGTYDAVEVYKIGDGNNKTAQALATKFGITVKTTKSPVAVTADTDFVIIFGKDRSTATTQR